MKTFVEHINESKVADFNEDECTLEEFIEYAKTFPDVDDDVIEVNDNETQAIVWSSTKKNFRYELARWTYDHSHGGKEYGRATFA